MILATTAPALLVLAVALGLTALSMLDEPHALAPAAIISTGGDN